jgi:uncharacterized membrane protein YfbV (UPF0208 family)
MSNENCGSDASDPQDGKARAARRDTRFKPGQSGNRKGRPKQKKAKTYGEQLHQVYTEPVVVKKGRKVQKMPTLIAIQRVYVQKALAGDYRAAAIVLKNAKEFVFTEKTEMHVCVCGYTLSNEVIARLTNQTIEELQRVTKQVEAEKEAEKQAKRKLH